MKRLTIKQKNIINFIKEFITIEGMAPTIQEIADYFKIKGSTTFAHIRSLQNKGILRKSSKARSIALVNNDNIRKPFLTSFSLDIPLLGRINAGYAVNMEQDMSQDQQTIKFDTALFSHKEIDELFCLQITGDSMQEVGIYEDDYIIVNKASQAKNNDIIVALVNKSETTVKFYHKINNMIELRPANYQYMTKKYYPEQVELQGIVIGLQRKF